MAARSASIKAFPSTASDRPARIARDGYIDKVYGVGLPVEQLEDKNLAYSNPQEPLPTGRNGLITGYPGETVVVGIFDSFDEVLTQSHRAVYSEIHISVDHTVYPSTSPLLGKTIDILEPGGTVILQNGKAVSFKNAPRKYGLMPHSRYVLFLRHIESGDFYLLADSILIDNGIALPNTPDSLHAALAGQWPLLGLREDVVLDSIQKQLPKQ